jgi:uncharacterized protein involved in outer membrane biogenesis
MPLPTRRFWRIFAATLGSAVLLIAIALAVLRIVLPPQQLSQWLAEHVSAASGRDFRIHGDLSVRILPTIAVVADDIELANADWGSRPEMVKLRRAAFEVELWPLLQGVTRILGISVEGVDLLLETDAQGRVNWAFGRPGTVAEGRASVEDAAIELDRFSVTDALIRYNDARSGKTYALVIPTLHAESIGAGTHVVAEFEIGQRRWQLEGEVGRFGTLFAGQEDWPYELRLATAGATGTASGQIGTGRHAGTLQSKSTVRIDDAAVLAGLVPDPAAIPLPLELSGVLQRTTEALRIESMRLSLAGQAVEGKVTLHTGQPRQHIEAELSSPAIDIANLRRGQHDRSGPTPAAGPPGPLFGNKPLPGLAMPTMPIQLKLRVERLAVPGAPTVSALAAQVRSESERLVVKPLSFGIAGGMVNASLELALAATDVPRATIRVGAKGMSLEAIDAASGHGGRFRGGRANLDANLSLSGRTPRALAASAHGDLLVSVSPTVLIGGAATLDRNVLVSLLHALIPGRSDNRAMTVECAVANLTLNHGIAKIDRTIALETDQLAVSASGELNLSAETVTLAFHPVVKKGLGLNPSSIASLVMLKGPLQKPEIGIDMAGTAREAATIGGAVATSGLSLLATRALQRPDQRQLCRRAAAARPTTTAAARTQRR